MSIEALFFVNWIFWAALSAGTMLLVGITERLGGTTRGYRLFMAWLLVAFAAVLVVSELNLPAGVEASMKFTKNGKETFVFVDATSSAKTGYQDGYIIYLMEREAMAQDIVANELGLYFVGLLFLYAMSSAFLPGVGRDAKHIAQHIAARMGGR